MTKKAKQILGIIKTKKSDRTFIQQAILDDWVWKWFGIPIGIIMYPVTLLYQLREWAYNLKN